jgi:hypothetical protein
MDTQGLELSAAGTCAESLRGLRAYTQWRPRLVALHHRIRQVCRENPDPGMDGARREKLMLSSKRLGLLLVAISVTVIALTAFVIYLSTTPR